jgi:hypothetical protein
MRALYRVAWTPWLDNFLQSLESRVFYALGQVVFPESDDTPTMFAKYAVCLRVSCPVAGDLFVPVLSPGSWHAAMLRATMPKAPINEDGHSERREDEVGLAGQREVPSPSADAVLSKKAEHGEFRCPVALGPDLRHDAGSYSGRDVVHGLSHKYERPGAFAEEFRLEDRFGRDAGGLE